jgi:hypothetical protein
MQLGGRAVEEALSVGQHDELRRVPVGFTHVVRREDDRRPLGRQRHQELPQPPPLPRVERGAGLVEQQEIGIAQETDRDVQPLTVAAGQRLGLVVRAVVQCRLLEHPRDGLVDVLALLEPREQPQVLLDRELSVQGELLRYPADSVGRADDLPRVGPRVSGEQREERGLARAVGTDHRNEIAGGGG